MGGMIAGMRVRGKIFPSRFKLPRFVAFHVQSA
jgi:hypothetical protein